VKQPDGKIGFEFEKKEPKAAAAKKTAKSATKDAETVTEGADEKPAPARKTAARKTTARKTGS
jgi:DNA topoisomerase-3